MQRGTVLVKDEEGVPRAVSSLSFSLIKSHERAKRAKEKGAKNALQVIVQLPIQPILLDGKSCPTHHSPFLANPSPLLALFTPYSLFSPLFLHPQLGCDWTGARNRGERDR